MESCNCTDIQPADEYLVILQRFLDAFTAIAYFSIPLEFIYFIWASPMLPDRWEFMYFGAFATVCGATYASNLWKYSNYSITVATVIMVVKVCAAVISWLTVLVLTYVVPNLTTLRKREFFLKKRASQLSRVMGLILHEEEIRCSIVKLMNEIRSTLDGQIIAKSTVIGVGRVFNLGECTLWFPSQTNKSLQLSHTLNHSLPVGYTVSVSLPVVAEILNSTGAVRIPYTCPLVGTTRVDGRFVVPEVVAARVPLLHYSSTEPNDWVENAGVSYAVMVLVPPSDSMRRFYEYELELVGDLAEQVAIALAHVSAIKESNMACHHLMEQNASLELVVRNIEMDLQASIVSQSAVLHQMSTLLHAMTTLSSFLLETKLTPQQRETSETVLRHSSSLETLVKNETELSRLEDGSLELNCRVFNLSASFKQVIDMIMPVAVMKKLFLSLDLAPNLPVYAVGDQERLMQIILHLVGNAVKFTKEGYVSVTASIARPEFFRDWRPSKLYLMSGRDHFYLRVQVEDSGCGIDPQETANLFNHLIISQTASNQLTIRGLGLPICKRLLNIMGGRIWVESEGLGKGSTATFIVKLGRRLNIR